MLSRAGRWETAPRKLLGLVGIHSYLPVSASLKTVMIQPLWYHLSVSNEPYGQAGYPARESRRTLVNLMSNPASARSARSTVGHDTS